MKSAARSHGSGAAPDGSPVRVFVGFDPRETVAFHVLAHSIQARASWPVSVTPLMLAQLQSIHWRERNPLQSTDFSFTRFLVPYLCGYEGWAIFMDCDMLMRDDVVKLWGLRDDHCAVQVVKHRHVPAEETKFLQHSQTRYEKKNWSSVMLFNNRKCRALTPEFVNAASGLELHQFNWLSGDDLIGALPPRWNHLVGYDRHEPNAALVHYTSGGPYFQEYRRCDFAEEWYAERERLLFADNPLVAMPSVTRVTLPRNKAALEAGGQTSEEAAFHPASP